MAYRRRSVFRRYKRRGYGPSVPYSRRSGVAPYRQLGVLGGNAIKVYNKYHSGGTSAGFDSPSVHLVSSIPDIGSGSLVNARDSHLVKILDLVMNCSLFWTESSACRQFRVMLIQWNEDSGLSTPTIPTILETSGTYSSTASDYMNCLQNVDEIHRCRVLFDQVFTPPVTKEGSGTTHVVPFRIRVIPPNRLHFHQGTTSARGHLYLFAWGDRTAVANDNPSFLADYRMRFLDY